MKNYFSFRRMPNVFTTVSRHFNGGRTGVGTAVKQVSVDCRSTVGRLSALILLLFALSFGFSTSVWAEGKQEQKGWQSGDTAYVVNAVGTIQETIFRRNII